MLPNPRPRLELHFLIRIRQLLKYGMKVEGEDLVDDIRPFYYSKLDTLYVRHEC